MDAWQHWGRVAGAMTCVWAAALAKEIGITTVATVVLLDLYLAPLPSPAAAPGRRSGVRGPVRPTMPSSHRSRPGVHHRLR